MTELAHAALIAALDRALIPELKSISSVLHKAGHKTWLVGGTVRDIARSMLQPELVKQATDWDLATSAEPKVVQSLFRRVIPTGIQHGTVTIVLAQKHFEVTTLRGERGHSDGRRPDEVFFVDDINSDLARRDFTVNAIAYNIEDKSLHDPFYGLRDLVDQRLRAVGDPAARFAEDGLRVLRCARLSATLDFDIEERTAKAIAPSLTSFEKVAQERVQQEWYKALGSRHPARFFRTIWEQGLLKITAPELFVAGGSFLLPSATAELLDSVSAQPLLRLALILAAGTTQHPTVAEQLSAANAEARSFAHRLKLSREQTHEMSRLVATHLIPEALVHDPHPAQIRRYLASIGRVSLALVLELQRASGQKAQGVFAWTEAHTLVQAQILEQSSSEVALSLGELKINGQDLIELGVPKGPRLGKILHALLELVLDEPARNERAELLGHAQELLNCQ